MRLRVEEGCTGGARVRERRNAGGGIRRRGRTQHHWDCVPEDRGNGLGGRSAGLVVALTRYVCAPQPSHPTPAPPLALSSAVYPSHRPTHSTGRIVPRRARHSSPARCTASMNEPGMRGGAAGVGRAGLGSTKPFRGWPGRRRWVAVSPMGVASSAAGRRCTLLALALSHGACSKQSGEGNPRARLWGRDTGGRGCLWHSGTPIHSIASHSPPPTRY